MIIRVEVCLEIGARERREEGGQGEEGWGFVFFIIFFSFLVRYWVVSDDKSLTKNK